jgi:hypothetical protein
MIAEINAMMAIKVMVIKFKIIPFILLFSKKANLNESIGVFLILFIISRSSDSKLIFLLPNLIKVQSGIRIFYHMEIIVRTLVPKIKLLELEIICLFLWL